MQITRILDAVRIFLVFPAVELHDFVAAAQHGEATQERQGGMHHQIAFHRNVEQRLVMRDQRAFHTAQAGRGAAAARILRRLVVVVQLAHGPTAGYRALVEVV